VAIAARCPSGRVTALRLSGSSRSVRVTRELEIRSLLGDIPSNFFILDPTVERGRLVSLTIKGAGFGHGVGLCQMGAYILGHMGYNYRQILGHYFQSVLIRTLYL